VQVEVLNAVGFKCFVYNYKIIVRKRQISIVKTIEKNLHRCLGKSAWRLSYGSISDKLVCYKVMGYIKRYETRGISEDINAIPFGAGIA
jgi:hypothetical protein